jgi:hypothetical protein
MPRTVERKSGPSEGTLKTIQGRQPRRPAPGKLAVSRQPKAKATAKLKRKSGAGIKAKAKKKPIARTKKTSPPAKPMTMAKPARKVAAGIHRRAARMTPQARAKADAATGKIFGARKKPVARAKPRQHSAEKNLKRGEIAVPATWGNEGCLPVAAGTDTDGDIAMASPAPIGLEGDASDLAHATEPTPINAKRKREPGGDSDRGFYLRLGDKHSGPANKKLVEAATGKLGIAMNKFAAAATMFFVAVGLNPTAVTTRANPGSGVTEIIPAAPIPEQEAGETEVAQAASA